MNKIQKRMIDCHLESCLVHFRMGWGKHELHDNLCTLLELIDKVCGEPHPLHPRFRKEQNELPKN